MTHTTDKLREEWRNNGFWTGDSIDKDLIPTEVMDKIADWWLSKLETAIKDRESELAEKIRKMLEGSEMQPHFLGGATKFVKKGRREAYETVLRLLHTDTNSKE